MRVGSRPSRLHKDSHPDAPKKCCALTDYKCPVDPGREQRPGTLPLCVRWRGLNIPTISSPCSASMQRLHFVDDIEMELFRCRSSGNGTFLPANAFLIWALFLHTEVRMP